MVAGQYVVCFFRFEEDVFWNKFVLENVVREFLLLVLLPYQL